MKEVYTFEDLESREVLDAGADKPARLAVIGWPIAHSASPRMHQAALDAEFIATEFAAELFNVLAAHIADVFQEERGEHIVLVLRGIDSAAKGVAGAPNGRKNVFLLKGGHDVSYEFWIVVAARKARARASRPRRELRLARRCRRAASS